MTKIITQEDVDGGGGAMMGLIVFLTGLLIYCVVGSLIVWWLDDRGVEASRRTSRETKKMSNDTQEARDR